MGDCCGKFKKYGEDKKESLPEQEKSSGEKFDYDNWQPSWQNDIDGEDTDKPEQVASFISTEVKESKGDGIGEDMFGDALPLECQDGYTPMQSRVVGYEESKVVLLKENHKVPPNDLEKQISEKKEKEKKMIECQNSVVSITYIRAKKD
eukprot:TRINITY_DN9310_c0_g1_i13.p1 TRINITY_DN9310_c0_g1~~TRINITY_DN9310_c0_g1_i13.p1  ORF type:complete len:149 (-),score=43.03 TRINITY_DN9310_c0_g1_i13:150-596(-)